jgi:hypothetical protein
VGRYKKIFQLSRLGGYQKAAGESSRSGDWWRSRDFTSPLRGFLTYYLDLLTESG